MRPLLALCGLALVLCASAGAATPADPNAWTSYGFDNQLTNGFRTDTFTLNAVPKLRLDWSRQLDGPPRGAHAQDRGADHVGRAERVAEP